ncbi:MAG: hypothetical protein IPG45_07675 [Deltaproteobacteria bacterium]|nr:hypothetical protein [Deltaproteobacteria bacterium]
MLPWILAAGLAAAPAPFVAVSPLAEVNTSDEVWIGPRAQELLADRLRLLGVDVAELRAAPTAVPPGYQGLIAGQVSPVRVESDQTMVTFKLELRGPAGVLRKVEVRGKAEAVAHLAAQAALQLAAALGAAIPERAELRLGSLDHPYAVEQLLGRAKARLLAGEARQARLLYERAGSYGAGLVFEAIEGRHHADGLLLHTSGGTFGTKLELAQAAQERADDAGRRGQLEERQGALQAVLQFAPDWALRFRWIRPFSGEEPFLEQAGRWRVGFAGEGRTVLDPRTGILEPFTAPVSGWVAQAQGEDLLLQGGRLVRQAPVQKAPRFSVALPVAPRSSGPSAFVDCGSALAILGQDAVAWIDPSTGQVGQIARGVAPMAADSAGVLVRPGNDTEVGLLRPGKKTTAWRTPVPEPLAAELTRDRAVLLTTAGLLLLKTYDGKPVRPPLPLSLEHPRLLGADGRYAAVAGDGGKVAVVDVLGGEVTATVVGPGPAVGAYSSAEGVALLFQSGDLLFFNRDGKLQSRARVPGAPRRLLRGSPEAPGPLVVTDRGLYAYAEAEVASDLRTWLALAEVLEKRGAKERALGLLDRLAERGAGQLVEIEGARARLLALDPRQTEASQAAQRRATCAADPTCPLPPFSL